MAKQKNKNAFWRFTSKLKKNRTELKEINVPTDQLINHYKKLFFVEDSSLSQDQIEISLKVKNYSSAYLKPSKIPNFTVNQLNKSLNELSNSSVKGFDQLSYQLIKKSITDASKKLLLLFYNSILTSVKIPHDLNIAIIKPILKDPNKNTDELNNIRPISISNTLSQILEKLILINSAKLQTTHKTQFGFKANTSCTLKETILTTPREEQESKLLHSMRKKPSIEYGVLVYFTN